jgi:hypothetical protein
MTNTTKNTGKRTHQQSKALHLFCAVLADALNNAGLDMRVVLRPEVSIPWSRESVKEQLWRPIQKAMYNKHSTTELNKKEEITQIHAVLMRHLGEKFHVEFINFPSYEHGYMDSAPLKSDAARYHRTFTQPKKERVIT